MKINVNNPSKVRAMLDEVNGRATAHVASPFVLQNVMIEAEKRLSNFGIPLKARQGVKVHFVSGQELPNAYKFRDTAIRNFVTLERGCNSWFVTLCTRVSGYSWSPGIRSIEVGSDAIDHANMVRQGELNIKGV